MKNATPNNPEPGFSDLSTFMLNQKLKEKRNNLKQSTQHVPDGNGFKLKNTEWQMAVQDIKKIKRFITLEQEAKKEIENSVGYSFKIAGNW